MKFIHFNNLEIKNFLSVGTEPVVIDFKKGLHIITGTNKDKQDRRNGVGKSTIADALYFAVFGGTLRELKNEYIVNNITKKKCQVTLQFTVADGNSTSNYTIIRTLSPSKCYLIKDGDDITLDSIANTNNYINSIINSAPDVFQNCIIMTVNNATPFMAKKKIEKRKFIEGILNLEVFSHMLKDARNNYNDVLREFDKECSKYEECSLSLEKYNEQKIESDNDREIKLKTLTERKKTNTSRIQELKKQITSVNTKDLDKVVKSIDKANSNLALCEDKHRNITGEIAKNEAQVSFLHETLSKIGPDSEECPMCLRSIDDHDREHIDMEKNKIASQINEINDTIKKCDTKCNTIMSLKNDINSQVANLRKDKSQIQNKINQNNSVKQEIKQISDYCVQIDEDIETTKNETNRFTDLISETEKRLEGIQDVVDNSKKELHVLDIVKFIVSEEGVKSYIVKKILQLLNSKLSYYLKKMDANCICYFNEYFEEQIIDEKGNICSYFNFSGAERKSIDLACLFAFMDIRRLQGDVSFNFSIYDELFDSSFDEKGTELVLGILKERIEKYNECMFIISHRKESMKMATGDIIQLEKKNGITTRVENITEI